MLHRLGGLLVLSWITAVAAIAPDVGLAASDEESRAHTPIVRDTHGNPRRVFADGARPSPDRPLGDHLADAVAPLDSDPELARKRLEALLTANDGLLDDVVLYYLGVADETDARDRARERYERVLAFPGSIAAPKAAARLAALLAEDGDTERVLELAATFAGNGNGESLDRARIALAAGKAVADTDPATASKWLMRARDLAPGTRAGYQARSELQELRAAHPELKPSAAHQIHDEASLAGREGDLKLRMTLLDRFLADHPDDPRAAAVVLSRAQTLARLEGRAKGAAWLDGKIAGARTDADRARFVYASAVHDWNAHASTRALEKFQRMLAMGTGISEEQRAWYAAGRIHESARRYTAAAAAYRKAADGKIADVRRESKWRAGWASYLAGNFEGAAEVFGAVAGRAGLERGVVTGREEALYWQARSLERTGATDDARAVYQTLIDEVPDGYYAFLVEERMGMHADAPVVEPVEVRPDAIPPGVARELSRSRELGRAGLREFSGAALSRASSEASPEVRRAMLPVLLELGAYMQALRVSLNLYQRGLLQEPQLYPYLYPHAFADIVLREATARDVDPYLVYSLIRQESLFNQRAVSPASAYGLMQLILPTARRMAPKAGMRSVDVDDLFQPEINVKLGVVYLAELARRFDDNKALVLASYNAGETAAQRWKDRLEGLELDEFIERISYRETRGYVKKILRNYRNYRRLYGGSDQASAAEAGQ